MDDSRKHLKIALDGLATRRAETRLYRDYFNGDHRTQLNSKTFTQDHRATIERTKDNQCRRVITLLTNLLEVIGFQPGTDDTLGKASAALAWQVWEDSKMDDQAEDWFNDAETTGEPVALMVTPDSEDNIRIWPHAPEDMWVQVSAERPGQALWAVRPWVGDDGLYRLTYLTGGDYHEVWVSPTVDAKTIPALESFTLDAGYGEGGYIPNVVPGICPVFVSDIKHTVLTDVIPLQDQLNAVLQQAGIAGEYYALATRVFLGMGLILDDETGKKKSPFGDLTLRELFLGSNDVSEGEQHRDVKDLPGQDPTPLLNAANEHRASIARTSDTPMHQLLQSGVAPSGESLREAKAPQTARVKSRQRRHGSCIASAAAYAVQATTRVEKAPKLATLWSDPSGLSEMDTAQVVAEYVSLGMPLSTALVRYAGWDQETADRVEAVATAMAAEKAAAAARAFDAGVPTLV